MTHQKPKSPLRERAGRAFALSLSLAAIFTAAAHANPPPEGSPQWNMTRPYKSFVTRMHNLKDGTNQWCCDLSDGRANLEERYVPGTNGQPGHYQVKVTQEAYEYDTGIPPEGRWIDIPNDKVIDVRNANTICNELKKDHPEEAATCKPPPFNILWRTTYDHVYCYWPRPQQG
jgi:hypothetical protein